MSEVPDNLQYTKDHEWIRLAEDGSRVIGVTDFAQESLGDVTFVDLPQVGASFETGEVFGVVESVKAASDLFMPISGQVVAVNDDLDVSPQKVNDDPYGEGWMIKVEGDGSFGSAALLNATEYQAIL